MHPVLTPKCIFSLFSVISIIEKPSSFAPMSSASRRSTIQLIKSLSTHMKVSQFKNTSGEYFAKVFSIPNLTSTKSES